MAERDSLSTAFLARAGWGLADRRFLAGDASDRSYDRLTLDGKTAVLMDAPPGKGDDPAAFLRIAGHLLELGLSAPRCLAQDLTRGFLLLEDFGDGVFARLIEVEPGRELPLYAAATDALLRLQSQPALGRLPDLSAADWAEAACFALDWYRQAVTGDAGDRAGFLAVLEDLISSHADGPRVMILRDYHAENLLWLPDRAGIGRVGILDFQLAQMGQPGYDLVSLLQDARRDVSRETQAGMIHRFKAATGAGRDFDAAYAVLGAQRALRILGVFTRLCLVAGKPGYLRLMPRVWGQLQQNLSHPVNTPLARACAALLPEPTPEILAEIGRKCPSR
ncbi:aminoglycoside phosphotransferase family protein [Tabrizicola oligotrophica]|uniref:Phosphotransferase n=1 Tax=Tabrizicola oligotrophica TaxID=2710650 RepID=A0A6M0QSA3_9RHOB|nr:phosphotransferase [Tabrizicola oligotrophica]NEY90325.1 phosphotransferase [Tabrizicola oligotrophica]